jgi:L-aminopeptidase/D-esterase-like protein
MGSGDLFLAFSTAPTFAESGRQVATVKMLAEQAIDPVYEATVDATEEAIVNAMVAAHTMTGADGYRVPALPHKELREVLARHGMPRH